MLSRIRIGLKIIPSVAFSCVWMVLTDGSHPPKFAKSKRSRMLLQGLFTILGIKRRLSFPTPIGVIKKLLRAGEKHSLPLSPKLSPDAGKCLYLCKVFRAGILARRRSRADIVQTAVNDRSDAQPADPPSARLPEERRNEPSSLEKKGGNTTAGPARPF